jgi:uncharacterized protein (DUF2237 family)
MPAKKHCERTFPFSGAARHVLMIKIGDLSVGTPITEVRALARKTADRWCLTPAGKRAAVAFAARTHKSNIRASTHVYTRLLGR